MTTDLNTLHAQLSHFARQLFDVQALRIATTNRVGAMERDGLAEVYRMPLQVQGDGLLELEKQMERQLGGLAKQHFMADWIAETRGIGPGGFARIIGVTGTLANFATVSKLWAYVGMGVTEEGTAPKRRRGEAMHFNPQGRVVCHQIADSIVKVGGPYRDDYDHKKAEYLARPRTGPSGCPFGQHHKDRDGKTITCGLAHAHNAAMRYAIKRLLRDMWCEWQKRAMAATP